MKKTMFFVMMLVATMFFVPNVFAAGEEAMIGDDTYATLSLAIENADKEDVIKLQKNVTLTSTLTISKEVTIDLNGFNIEKDNTVIIVDGGKLTLTGEGTIKETAPDNAGVKLYGANSKTDEVYSYLSVGKDVTIEAWAPVFISIKQNSKAAYGVDVDVYGKLVSKKDTNNEMGNGLYINGTIQDKECYPTVEIHDGTVIESEGFGMYLAGYADVKVGKATINAADTGIAIKAGKLALNGTIVKASGKANDPITNNNGINGVGAAIQIESNATKKEGVASYAGDIEITINGGKYESENNSAIVEYLADKEEETSVKDIKITDGEFIAALDKDVIEASDEFKEENTKFVSGGTFSSSVKEYLAEGVIEGSEEDNYKVVEEVKDNTENPNTSDINIISMVLVLLLGVLGLAFTVSKRRFN